MGIRKTRYNYYINEISFTTACVGIRLCTGVIFFTCKMVPSITEECAPSFPHGGNGNYII